MAETTPDRLVLELLQAIRSDISGLTPDIADLKYGMTTVEIQLGQLASTETSHYAGLATRFDRMSSDIDRIKVRLELRSEPAG